MGKEVVIMYWFLVVKRDMSASVPDFEGLQGRSSIMEVTILI